MKKRVAILMIMLIITNVMLSVFHNISLAIGENNEKKNEQSYWSTSNAPLFYGATKITIKKGMVNEFNVFDTRFRIFAKDFEDGDLTPQITYSGEVDVNRVGNYEIHYQVKDSHNNVSELKVPVIITDAEDAKINVERTVYTIPSVWNMDLAGFSRCNYGDRQILGVYLPNKGTLRARILSADNNMGVAFLKNDSVQESSQNIPQNGEWVTLQNIKEGAETGGSVPLLTSSVLKRESTDLTKTFKIELEYDNSIKELTYYHYLDSEEKFREKWNENQDTYAVIENEVLTIVVPYTDINKLTNYHKKGFTTLDSHLEYYKKVVDKMDEYIGLSLNPEKLTDQNVRTKYLVKANAHGAGAAYYAGNHVGINNPCVHPFFEMNWGGLHEIAHGYQGSLGKGQMQLGEVANNIIGHYIQIDKDIYFHSADWLGKLNAIEEGKNKARLEGKSFTEVDVSTRLYMIINLFDTFEGGTTYGKMFSWYREQLNSGKTKTNQDAYVKAIADIYHVNIIPYMESWELSISDSAKEEVYSQNYPMMGILKDMVSQESLDKIVLGEQIGTKYGLVMNDTLQKYDLKGNLSVHINIDDMEKLKGEIIQIKENGNVIQTAVVNDSQVQIKDLPIGNYYLQMPVDSDYRQEQVYVTVKEGENTINYTYEPIGNVDYNNYLSLKLQGIYGTYGYELTFSDNFTKGKVHLNGANMGNNISAYVKIYDETGKLISTESTANFNGTVYFENYQNEDYTIDFKPGYTIEVQHQNYANRVKVFSTLSGKELTNYKGNATITKYIVTDNGLIREDMQESDSEAILYEILKEKLIGIIEEYKNSVTEEELNDKTINFRKKAEVVSAYNSLKEADRVPYEELITRIKNRKKVMMGDIDTAEEITVKDLALIKLHLIEMKTLTGESLKVADMDGDGEITVNDVAMLKMLLIG